MALKVKDGVVFKQFTEAQIKMITVAYNISLSMEVDTVITSAEDGKHMKGSLHYKGLALDFRTRHMTPIEIEKFINALCRMLGRDYQVIKEADHVHVERDRK